ncbi:MAG: BolA family protein [Panacagrimonas sp.]
MSREARIRTALATAFPDAVIELIDESHLHAGHAGARSGRGHYRLRIVAEVFAACSPVARHRAVYAALGELMQTDIHALAIDAQPG